MDKKLIIAVPCLALLAACNGTSDVSETYPTIDVSETSFNTLKVFSDGVGVAKGRESNGTQTLVIAPDIALVVQEANNATQEDIASVRVSDFPVVQALSTNANLRQGTMTSSGVVFNATAIEDLGGEAGLVLLEIPNQYSAAFATGTALTGTPVGSHTYNGTMTMGARSVNPNQELGSFSMTADFNASSYTFSGSTSNNSLSGSGVIDAQSGTFNSNNLSASTNGTSRTATMYGQLHGNAATSVSGLFHTNESSAYYAGGFVGSR